MKSLIKNLILLPLVILNLLASVYCFLINHIKNGLGSFWLDKQTQRNQSLKKIITHSSKNKTIKLSLFTPNCICRYRADSFSTKEPETLEWIDDSEDNGVLFDIGANIGLYSLYYTVSNKGKAYAFEPSVFNLALLAKNIFENNLQDKIKIITNPLTQENQFANFTLSNIEEGGALSAFGVEYGHDGEIIKKSLSYQTLGLSLDFLLRNKIITDYPNLIKIDVDGIEHLILAGAVETLKNPSCKTVLIEISNLFVEQAQSATKILLDCGFKLTEKKQSEITLIGKFAETFNQIWVKT
jgi:FkbM family methyltransferase